MLNIDSSTSTNLTIPINQSELLDTDGTTMFAGGITSSNLTFSLQSNKIVGAMTANITSTVFYDEFQLFLNTEDGTKWLIDNPTGDMQRLTVGAGKQQILFQENITVQNNNLAGTLIIGAEVVSQEVPFDVSLMGSVQTQGIVGMSENDFHSYLDSYLNKQDWQADTSNLATQSDVTNIINQILSLNNITVNDIWNATNRSLTDKDNFNLSTSQYDAIATEVESHLLDEADGQTILNAIVSAIGNTNVDEVALVAAIRADLERVNGKMDNIDQSTSNIASDVWSDNTQYTGTEKGKLLQDAKNKANLAAGLSA